MVATVMQQFTSTARKDGRWWVVKCDQHPGAISQVARLDQAQDTSKKPLPVSPACRKRSSR